MVGAKINVPAGARTVKDFVDTNRDIFVKDFKTIRSLVERSLSNLAVYKIYGRNEKQSGDDLKHPRKIRLKFNDYNTKHGISEASLWEISDIIGFTIVVAYPSGISEVCFTLDYLISSKQIRSAYRKETEKEKNEGSDIKTVYGKIKEGDGYFACHYNVKSKGVRINCPICEIQVKTILHDAWGAKSHKLTYKPSGATNQDLIDNFNLLGDTLAKIDQQSDLIRRAIDRTATVRLRKRARVQNSITMYTAKQHFASFPDSKILYGKISKINHASTRRQIGAVESALFELFDRQPYLCCLGLCALASQSGEQEIFQQAQEAIEVWHEQAKTPLERVGSKAEAALASFIADDVSNAIDEADEAIVLLGKIDLTSLSDEQKIKYYRIAISTYTSLGYYHADRIGSHEGTMGESFERALRAVEESKKWRELLPAVPNSLDEDDSAIKAAIEHLEWGWFSFSVLDNEAFIRIQTAETENELRQALKKLELIHEDPQPQIKELAGLLYSYHEYCARSRLADLEVG